MFISLKNIPKFRLCSHREASISELGKHFALILHSDVSKLLINYSVSGNAGPG